MTNPFDYVSNLSTESLVKIEDIRNGAKELAATILTNCPDSREKSLAMTNLEQAIMWANKAVSHRN